MTSYRPSPDNVSTIGCMYCHGGLVIAKVVDGKVSPENFLVLSEYVSGDRTLHVNAVPLVVEDGRISYTAEPVHILPGEQVVVVADFSKLGFEHLQRFMEPVIRDGQEHAREKRVFVKEREI